MEDLQSRSGGGESDDAETKGVGIADPDGDRVRTISMGVITKVVLSQVLACIYVPSVSAEANPFDSMVAISNPSDNKIFSYSSMWSLLEYLLCFLCGCAVTKWFLQRNLPPPEVGQTSPQPEDDVTTEDDVITEDDLTTEDDVTTEDEEDDVTMEDVVNLEDDVNLAQLEDEDGENLEESVDAVDSVAEEEARKKEMLKANMNLEDAQGQTRNKIKFKGLGLVSSINSLIGTDIEGLFSSSENLGNEDHTSVLVYTNREFSDHISVKRIPFIYRDEESVENEFRNQEKCSVDFKNITQVYSCIITERFGYIIRDVSHFSLAEVIEFRGNTQWGTMRADLDTATKSSMAALITKKWGIKLTSLKLKIIKDIVRAVEHMHSMSVVHRKLDPKCIQIHLEESSETMVARITNFSASKSLSRIEDSFSYASDAIRGDWKAPEQSLGQQETCAVDLFNLGCIIAYIITGMHPFDDGTNSCAIGRNIEMNLIQLTETDFTPEALHLVTNLLDTDPSIRFRASDVLEHPLFWSQHKRMSFISIVSNRIDTTASTQSVVSHLSNNAHTIKGVGASSSWTWKIDPDLFKYINDRNPPHPRVYCYYNYVSARDLIRLVRNLSEHYNQLDVKIKTILGTDPEGIDSYFRSRFPHMLIQTYIAVLASNLKHEAIFKEHFHFPLYQF